MPSKSTLPSTGSQIYDWDELPHVLLKIRMETHHYAKIPDVSLVIPIRPKGDLRCSQHLWLDPLSQVSVEPTGCWLLAGMTPMPRSSLRALAGSKVCQSNGYVGGSCNIFFMASKLRRCQIEVVGSADRCLLGKKDVRRSIFEHIISHSSFDENVLRLDVCG